MKEALEQQMQLRQSISAGGRFPVSETVVESAAHGYDAALDRLQALHDRGASDGELRQARMEVNLARMVFDEAMYPRRTPSDPPPWAVGLGTFVKEFGKGALAVASLGGTAAIERAYKSGRLDGRSGVADALQIYLEGVFNGVTFGAGNALADARAGQGRSVLGSSGAALLASLKNVSGYDDLRTIFNDPHANAYDKAQAMATLVAKWAGLAAVGISGTRYANVELRSPLARKPTPAEVPGPVGADIPGIVPRKTTAVAVSSETAASAAEARTLAARYYKESGWPASRIEHHLRGIDFGRPVEVVELPAGTKMVQYQLPGRPAGNYFAPLGTPPEHLGISPRGRISTTYVTTKPMRILRSTAAAVEDTWTVPGRSIPAQGGGTQYFVVDPSSLTRK